jgi:hypothetical protein
MIKFVRLMLLGVSMLSAQTVLAQIQEIKSEKSKLTIAVSGGLANSSGSFLKDNLPPYGFIKPQGGYFSASARYALRPSLSLAGEISYRIHAYDVEKAGKEILHQDMYALSANVEAKSYNVLTVAVGPCYEWKPSTQVGIIASAMVGMAIHTMPEIKQFIKTAPHTDVTYLSTHLGAFYGDIALRPTWYIHSNWGVGLVLSMGYSQPKLDVEGQSQSLQQMMWRGGIELSFRL